MSARILHVRVGERPEAGLARAAGVMEALEQGRQPAPYFGISFADMEPLLALLTPRRWALIAVLREGGPMRVAELARRLGRDYKNVHQDVAALMTWQVLERDEVGRARVAYDEIVLEVKLPGVQAA